MKFWTQVFFYVIKWRRTILIISSSYRYLCLEYFPILISSRTIQNMDSSWACHFSYLPTVECDTELMTLWANFMIPIKPASILCYVIYWRRYRYPPIPRFFKTSLKQFRGRLFGHCHNIQLIFWLNTNEKKNLWDKILHFHWMMVHLTGWWCI